MITRSQGRALSSNWAPLARYYCRALVSPAASTRFVHTDHRARLSKSYIPLRSITSQEKDEGSHTKLIQAGILRQAHSGIFHLLPLGFRVQEKIKKVIDRHMEEIGASRLSLSTISTPRLWQTSRRYAKAGPELFQFSDRKESKYLLSPTHEEEITSLVKQTVSSHKALPLRLYQITRKYRDEARPRKGLLRSREFVMKDLYTFDLSVNDAMTTYNLVRSAYDKIFAEMRLPVRVAEASSGDIGGDLSHEYHLPTALGEDDLISCSNCGYTANSEVAETRTRQVQEWAKPAVWRGISKDRSTLINAWYPESVRDISSSRGSRYTHEDVNIHAVKGVIPDIDGSVKDVRRAWWSAMEGFTPLETDQQEPLTDGERAPQRATKLINIVDYRLPESFRQALGQPDTDLPLFPFPKEDVSQLAVPPPQEVIFQGADGEPLNLLKIMDGDPCPKCESGVLGSEKAIELGHTFHLGVRYSEPMGLSLVVAPSALEDAGSSGEILHWAPGSNTKVVLQMGCHGIGVSRIIGAVAEHLADDKGLNWPRAIAPYDVVIVAGQDAQNDGSAEKIHDLLAEARRPKPAANASSTSSPPLMMSYTDPLDLLIDDRDKNLPWKLKDADLVGYPVVVVLGKEWTNSGRCEVQCRRLGVKKFALPEELSSVVYRLLDQL